MLNLLTMMTTSCQKQPRECNSNSECCPEHLIELKELNFKTLFMGV